MGRESNKKSLTPYFSVESKRIKQKWALVLIDVFMAKAQYIICRLDAPNLKPGVNSKSRLSYLSLP